MLATLLEGGRQTSLSSVENLNSKEQLSASCESVEFVAEIQHTA
jgi:hypothetical protein